MLEVLKYDPYLQTEQCEKWLREKAAQGYFIRKLNSDSIYVQFDQAEPKQVYYAIFYDSSRKFNTSEFIDVLFEQGWDLVGKSKSYNSIYLFMNESEHPIPIETDLSVMEFKQKKLLKSFVLNFILALIVILMNMYTWYKGIYNYFSILIYVYLSYIYFLDLFRFIMIRKSQEIKDKAVKIIRIGRRVAGFVSIIAFILISLRYMEVKQINVNENNLVHLDNKSLINETYTKSMFSLNPNYTSFYIIENDNSLNQIVYQTKLNVSWLNPTNFEIYVSDQTPYLKYGNPQKYDRIESDLDQFDDIIMYQSENKQEFYTFIQLNKVIYTLHTINLNQDEHQKLLLELGEK